jgi:hypothetical protein
VYVRVKLQRARSRMAQSTGCNTNYSREGPTPILLTVKVNMIRAIRSKILPKLHMLLIWKWHTNSMRASLRIRTGERSRASERAEQVRAVRAIEVWS